MTDTKQDLMNQFFEDHKYIQPLPDWHKDPEATVPQDDDDVPQTPLRAKVQDKLAPKV